MNWTIILLIIISIIVLAIIIPYAITIYWSLKGNEIGINIIFFNAYNVIKNKMGDQITEESAIFNAFSGIHKRAPFNLLSNHDIDLIIKTLEPFVPYRPFLFAALIFIADCVKDASFLRNPKQIIYELIKQQEHFQKKNRISTDQGVTPILRDFYFRTYHQIVD